MTTDVLVTQEISGYYDLSLNEQGDLANGDFFDSSILYSIFGERRASASEVAIAERRRGWIGNVGKDFENGSKIWLYFQARLTRDVMNGIKTEALKSLQWLVDDDYLERIDADVVLQNGVVNLIVVLYRYNSPAERRYYTLWENTGVSSAT